jgi:ubiquinone/menaquinone biosynthesis C-methylase UbiE
MKTVAKPQNLMEWIAVKANLVPAPLAVVAWIFLSKAVLLASKLDVFEAAKNSPQTIEQIAQRTKLHPRGLRGLMNILTLHGYFKYKDGKFGLTKLSRKWCLKESPDNVCNQLRYVNEIAWNEMNYLEEFLKTGKGLEVHDNYYTEEQWNWYQLGQYDQAKITARSAPKMTPMPSNPTEMLDIGGSHGLYSVELCKKYPTLKATILDLPEAVEKARPILERFDMGDRINYWIGNALTDDFGENRYDLILMSSLTHHFSSEQNIAVSKKAAKALKPAGYFVIQDCLRPEPSSRMDELGIVLDMYFNLTSTTGTWSLNELKDFQEKAGLTHHKVNKFMEIPSLVQVCAKKE